MRYVTMNASSAPMSSAGDGRETVDSRIGWTVDPTLRDRILLIAPVLIVATTFAVFQGAVSLFGLHRGYVTGFLFYWIVWGVGFSLWAVGIDGVRRMLGKGRPQRGGARLVMPLLIIPPLAGALFFFPSTFPSATAGTVVTFAAIGLVNGTLEEILWRGVYATAFPNRAVAGFLLPSAWFGLLQLGALSVYPSDVPGGTVAVVASAFVLGLIYGFAAWRSGSIRWTIVSHVLMNAFGIGVVIYLAA